ncbi:hypothetical protein [Ehrlichia japonica]|uniref:Uncharacterized protein n=1 Tax=Ehrlichia japonica TaxID=391036 RepID=X5H2L1_9RICK|nr:hypothetical protein [Ehrlichia japonica]AHX04335.1 hypothetical protein EHF_0474 [Ehrlichia japonica]
MIHSGNQKHSMNNTLLTTGAILSTTVALVSALTTIYSGINLALDLDIPGIPKTSVNIFFASFVTFMASTLLLIGASITGKYFEVLQNKDVSQKHNSDNDTVLPNASLLTTKSPEQAEQTGIQEK